MATPHLILVGYGVTDSLQLTVEGQRVLARYGSAYSLSLPPNLAAYLKTQRVKLTELAPRLASRTDAADGYLNVAQFAIERTARERPVTLLCPGHPLMFNAIGRYLAMEAKRLGLGLQVVPGISQLDLIIGGIGLDVSTFGLQVFDAARLVARRQPISPDVPLLLMHLGAFGQGEGDSVGDLGVLIPYLSRCYPPDHAATVVDLGPKGMTVAATPLRELGGMASKFGAGAHLFIDAVRTQPHGQPA